MKVHRIEFTSTKSKQMTLIDLSNHLRFDRELNNDKIEAILLRWGARSQLSEAIVTASATTVLRYVGNTIKFNPDDLLRVGLRESKPMGVA